MVLIKFFGGYVSGFSRLYKLSSSDEDVFMFLATSSQILFYNAAATAEKLYNVSQYVCKRQKME